VTGFLLMLAGSVGSAALPILLFLETLRLVGLEVRESRWRLGLAVVWGAAGGVALGLLWATGLGRQLSVLLVPGERELVESVFSVPLAEELAKGVVFVLARRWRRLATPLPGLLYGVAAGLGFAMTENFAFFLRAWLEAGQEAWFGTVVLRTGFSAVLHGVTTGVWGAAIGFALSTRRPWPRRLLPYGGLAAALTVHVGWNLSFVLSGLTGEGCPLTVSFGSVPVVVGLMLLLAWTCVGAECRVVERELLAEARAGVLPKEHAHIVARPRRRITGVWLAVGVNRRAYVRAALTLVSARRHARSAGLDPDAEDLPEVVEARERLARILDRRA